MEKKSKTRRRRGLIAGIAVIFITAGALGFGAVSSKTGGSAELSRNIRSAEVQTGNILSTVSASGTLRGQEAEAVILPEGVKLDELLVKPGERVTRGQALASVVPSSVDKALTDAQKQLDSLASQLERSEADTDSKYVTAKAQGRVKEIYARKNEHVSDVVAEHGGLLLLSLDGKMELRLSALDQVAIGDEVNVQLESGKTEIGTVEGVHLGQMLITLTDNGPVNGTVATVYSLYGTELGSSVLSVHCPLLVTGYTGAVASIPVKEEQIVRPGTTLFTLSDLGHTAAYLSLLEQQKEQVQNLQTLLALRESDAVTAPFDGVIESVQPEGGADELVRLIPLDRMYVDLHIYELDILSVALGQQVMLTVDALDSEVLTGTVSGINEVGENNGGVTRYTVEVTLDRTESMRAGMNASAEIVIARHEGCLTVPEAALCQSGNTTFVCTAFNEETGELSGEVPVTTGTSDGEYVQILTGLNEGTRIYYRYAQPEENAKPTEGGFPF